MSRIPSKQLKFEFKTEFFYHINPEDELIKLAEMIDWDLAEKLYSKTVSSSVKNTNSISGRIAFGALILLEMNNYTGAQLILEVKRSPYFQYFLGMEEFKYECPFSQSSITQFKKRITPEMVQELNESICQSEENIHNDTEHYDSDTFIEEEKSGANQDMNEANNKGKLILDATCTPQDIKFPTDWDLLNKAREKTEAIIDHMHNPMVGIAPKPRTYRVKARRSYLSLSKSKKKSRSKIRKVIRFQLECVKRNLSYINDMHSKPGYGKLNNKQRRDLMVIHELYRQQRYMYDHQTHTIDNRIVSIHSPHIRPIVRGKATALVEFGAKLAISVVNGYCYLEKLSWDVYNEGQTLIDSVERYKDRFGHYPTEVLADRIYRNRENLKYLKERGIKMIGPKLGRPKKNEVIDKQAERKAEGERNIVEAKFGQGKRAYSLGLIMTKRRDTSETTISLILLVMNLKKRLSLSFAQILIVLKSIANLRLILTAA